MTLPDLPGVLSAEQVAATAEAIAELQRPDGMVLWYPGGHADPWNHVEALMGLNLAGRRTEAERGFDWLAATQHDDGSWCSYYVVDAIKDPRRDTNVSTYVAVGAWHHWLLHRDPGFLAEVFPLIERAVGFALSLQQPGGEVLWSIDPDSGAPAEYALLTGSSSVYLSLRCAIAIAGALGYERPDWEMAAGRLGWTIANRPDAFEPKRRWAMDWYYPVLCGTLGGREGAQRIDAEWPTFVMEGFGVRCVSDNEWVTAAETAELVLALDVLGRTDAARRLLTSVQYLREADGSYWTGCVHPDEIHYPEDERSTYTAGAVLLAADALGGLTSASGLFRGDGLPSPLWLVESLESLEDPEAPGR